MNTKRIILTTVAAISILSATFPAFADINCDANVDYYTLATDQYTQGQYQAAVDSYTCLTVARPDSVAAFNGRGNAYRSLGNYEAAIVDYTQAIELDETYAVGYNNRGWTYYNMEAYDLALVDFNRAIELDPTLAYAYNNRGLIYQMRGEYALAMADFNQAIALGLQPTWAEYNLEVSEIGVRDAMATLTGQAITAYDVRDFELAVMLYTDIIALDSNNAIAHYYRGRSLIALDRFAEAAADFDRLIELQPEFTFAYWERAIAYAEMGDFEQAIADAEVAQRANPDHVNNYITFGTIAALSGDSVEAGTQFLSLMEAWGTNRIEIDALTVGAPATVEMYEGYVYVMTFEGSEGDVIDLLAHSTEADPVIVLLDADGLPLSGDDDSGMGLDSLIAGYELPADGTYTLLVSHAGGGYQGTVEVGLTIR